MGQSGETEKKQGTLGNWISGLEGRERALGP